MSANNTTLKRKRNSNNVPNASPVKKAIPYTKNELKNAMNSSYRHAFSGNTQNVSAYNAGHAYEANYREMELAELEAKKKALQNRIFSQEAQDEDAMYELEDVEKNIVDLKQYISDYQLKGGYKRSNKRGTKRTKRSNKRSKRARRSHRK